MKATRKLAAVASATLLATSALAVPSVEITNVQQQYPWTNTVDITYTVSGVKDFPAKTATGGYASNETYFVTFEATDATGAAIKDVDGNTVFTNALVSGSGSGQVAQWSPALGQQLAGCTLTPSVFRGEENAYMIVNLETGEVVYEPMSTQDASNARYNTKLYKTAYLVLRRVPKGEYWIGGPEDAKTKIRDGANSHHKAVIPKDYYIAIFELTEAQWDRLANDRYTSENTLPVNNKNRDTIRGSASVGAKPLTGILAALNVKTGDESEDATIGFDLPTETMWEVAARAMNTNKWVCGNSDAALRDYAWYAGIGGATRHEVGGKKPNAWGLYDVHGGQYELCLDVFDSADLASLAQSANGLVPTTTGINKNGNCTYRGGSWIGGDGSSYARFSSRHGPGRTATSAQAGFRVAFIPRN